MINKKIKFGQRTKYNSDEQTTNIFCKCKWLNNCNTDENSWNKSLVRKKENTVYDMKGKENIEVWKYDIKKSAKTIKPRCNCNLSNKTDSKLQCSRLTEEHRRSMFNKLWKQSLRKS